MSRPATSKKHDELLAVSTGIKHNTADVEPVLMAKFLIQCNLPHSNPGDVRRYMRQNGSLVFTIQPGWDVRNDRPYEIPHGMLPRYLLVWLATEAKRTGSRTLFLGDSLAEFMRKLEIDPTHGGKKATRGQLRQAMEGLFSARISFEMLNDPDHIADATRASVEVTSASHLWWNALDPNAGPGWASWIELGEKFYEQIMKHSIPSDMRALRELRNSPLAFDLYMLCNWLGDYLTENKKSKHWISWSMLEKQMGGNYKDHANLKKKVQVAMRKVKLLHPDLNYAYDKKRGGLIVYPSPPAVPRKIEPARTLVLPKNGATLGMYRPA